MENFCLFAERQIEKGQNEPPYAYLIPEAQKDWPTALKLIEVIQKTALKFTGQLKPLKLMGLTIRLELMWFHCRSPTGLLSKICWKAKPTLCHRVRTQPSIFLMMKPAGHFLSRWGQGDGSHQQI